MFLLCMKIFLVRILDVSLGTIRTIITVKEKNLIASIIGFIEILIWFLIAKEAINTNVDSIYIAISYSLGFATGTYIGGLISHHIIKTNLKVQIISSKGNLLTNLLRENNYAVTVIGIKGINEDNVMLLLEIPDTKLISLKNLVTKIDSKAFVTISETKYVFNGYLGN